jgi:UDP-GlcNAc3NAcA epimerase
MKIITVVGARPQFVKAASVSRAIGEYNDQCDDGSRLIHELIVHTGQHYAHEMSQVFFDELEIPHPHYHLNVGSGSHGKMTGMMLEKIEAVLMEERPDFVLVYGDTNSTLAGALAASKLHLPIAHVEAGLRSFNRRMPEEINRLVADHLSTLLFCPTPSAMDNLRREGIEEGAHQVGDVMYDAVQHYRRNIEPPACQRPFALASLHRAENTDELSRLESIVKGLGQSPIPVVLPLHPRTQKVIQKEGITLSRQVTAMAPVSYLRMLAYLDGCSFVITDSGGLQKEAFFFGKKCITVRDETEWVELVEAGSNKVVGANQLAIREAYSWAMQPLSEIPSLYGDGHASHRIVDCLINHNGGHANH